MGNTAENVAQKYQITRDQQDAFAADSQRKAGEAMKAGRFRDEIVPVTVKTRKGEVVVAAARAEAASLPPRRSAARGGRGARVSGSRPLLRSLPGRFRYVLFRPMAQPDCEGGAVSPS
jgi:hypothetical protein